MPLLIELYKNNEYFKCIDKNKYIIMDLILTHESKRVFCIFEESSDVICINAKTTAQITIIIII